ncbi:caspase family protein [Acaryochloris sp. IP29b_bin.137]|uniref:caspase family protein n=1 Tax=Acaryochloris sp. IP29b_bin.137 TaxID=2969217 RepID=UPI0026108FDF|nr:caspase family protein [Acaryochloris sp. IP29b_bin.137]
MQFDNAYALIIGISNYKHISSLPATVINDAQDIYNLLISQKYCGYINDNVYLLLNNQATKNSILGTLEIIANRSNTKSTILLYISSHGGQIESGPHSGEYLLTVDTNCKSEESFSKTAISSAELTRKLQAIPAKKMLTILDCCHAGGIGQPKKECALALKEELSADYYDLLKQGLGRAILASSRANEFSYFLSGSENSLFTQHLLAGLKGEIVSNDGVIRIFDLFEYLQPKVTQDQHNQHPIFKAELEENIPVSLYLGGQRGIVPTIEEDFRYDAYISYIDKEPDAIWVWETLVPRLKNAGLKIAISGDVDEPGVARVVNIERGITQSKRILIVLSENYLADSMAEFENVLAQTMGIQEGNYRLLPLKTTPIDYNRLPIRLSMLAMLDLTHARRAESEFERLVKALKGPLFHR